MDPLSIAVAALSAAKVCGFVSWELGKFIKETELASATIEMLIRDMMSFESVLNVMHETVEDPTVKASVGSMGRIGNFWHHLLITLQDAEKTLNSLGETVARVNKNAAVLDSARKQLRLKLATDEIARYQHQITSYKDTIQILLHTTILWQQVTDKEAADKVIPRLDETQQMIRRLAVEFRNRMTSMEKSMKANPSPETAADSFVSETAEYKTLDNLRSSLKVAVSVITSASTTLGRERIGAASTVIDSDFGDVFPPDPSDLTLSWIEAISESEEPPSSRREELQGINELEFSDELDTDDDELRQEMIQAFLRLGCSHIELQQYDDAQRELQNCVDQLSADIITGKPFEIPSLLLDAMSRLVNALMDQHRWGEAQKVLKEKLAFLSRVPKRDESMILEDTLLFSEILLHKGDFMEALLYGKKTERGYRKQKAAGIEGRKNALRLIVVILTSAGNGEQKDAEGYRAILESISDITNAEGSPFQADAATRLSMSSSISPRDEEAVSVLQDKAHPSKSVQSTYQPQGDASSQAAEGTGMNASQYPTVRYASQSASPESGKKKMACLRFTSHEMGVSNSKTTDEVPSELSGSQQLSGVRSLSRRSLPAMDQEDGPREAKNIESRMQNRNSFMADRLLDNRQHDAARQSVMLQDKAVIPESTKLTGGIQSRLTSQSKIKVCAAPQTIEPDVLGSESSLSREKTPLSQEEIDEMIDSLSAESSDLLPSPDDAPRSEVPAGTVDELYRRMMAGELVNRGKRSRSVEEIRPRQLSYSAQPALVQKSRFSNLLHKIGRK